MPRCWAYAIASCATVSARRTRTFRDPKTGELRDMDSVRQQLLASKK